LYRFNPRPGKYLAFFGSLSLEGGLGLAIELARRAHLLLRVASPQNGIDACPLSIAIELLIADPGVEWLGELREEEKNDFLGEALAFVCTHDWPGPSGLCVAEALACGTPVVACHGGNAAEMIYDHATGFTCESLEEMVEVLPLIGDLDRRECRGAFEQRFSAERMADQYLQLYERLIVAAKSPRVFDASVVQAVQTDTRPVAVSS
jgi:glycosyltransferase involved in cell wall biosynthesis